MPEEYILPGNESPEKSDELLFRRFYSNEIPEEISAIKREDLSYIGNWMAVKRGDGYGFFYRLGIKENFLDSDGDIATLFLHYVSPFKKRGLEFNPKIVDQITKQLQEVVELFTQITVQRGMINNTVSAIVTPTKSMKKELEKLIKAP